MGDLHRFSPKPPLWLPRAAYVAMVSEFFHGEAATANACRRLSEMVEGEAMRRVFEAQAVDEEKHLRLYESYLFRLGDSRPQEPTFRRAFEDVLTWDTPPLGIVVAIHLILEDEALSLLKTLVRRLPCPVLAEINRQVARDEARHVVVGRSILQGGVKSLSADDRFEIARRVKGLWQTCADDACERYGRFVGSRRCRDWLNARWVSHESHLKSLGLVTR